jgi:hypothetical protein
MRFPRLTIAAVALVALATGGCDSSTALAVSPGNLSNVPGYTLVTVNAAPLPVEVRNDAGGRVAIAAGSLVFGDSARFQQALTLAETPAGGAPSTRTTLTQGTVTVRGDRIQFHASDGGEWEGVMSGNRLDYSVPGNSGAVAFSFQR